MTLKEQIDADIDAVFFQMDELAEYRNIDGRVIPVIQDDDRILERTDISAFGTSLGDGLIFVRAADMPHMPLGGEELTIDSKKWYVRDAKHNWGVYEIRIGRERAYD